MSSADPQISRMIAKALWITGLRQAELREAPLPASMPDPVLIRTLWSGISRGTERLVFDGSVPASEYDSMCAPWQEGEFPFPVKYGYSAVGEVESGSWNLVGRTVFALYPHQNRFVLSADDVIPIPNHIPPRRAVLTPSMETALNAVWDAGSVVGNRIAIVGAGIIGFLIAHLLNGIPGCDVTLVDIDPERRIIAEKMGLTLKSADQLDQTMDLVFHASATSQGLQVALELAGFESTVIEVSWYGDYQTSINLGGAFHSRRLKLISSQVAHVSPSQRARWDRGRRIRKALSLLTDERLDHLLTTEIAFDDLPRALPSVFAPLARGLAPVVRYE